MILVLIIEEHAETVAYATELSKVGSSRSPERSDLSVTVVCRVVQGGEVNELWKVRQRNLGIPFTV